MNIYKYIIEKSDEMYEELTAYRQDFHKYAETGWLEMRTSSLIARELTDLGFEVLMGDKIFKKDFRMGLPSEKELEKQYERAIAQGADSEFVKYTKGGMTGVIGILCCGAGPTVAMRFDIDALAVLEEKDKSHRPSKEGFISVNEGVMHACGHDGHAAIGLGVAKILVGIKDFLHGTVKLIFQPSEEEVRGARPIVYNGHLDNVDYFISSHITSKEDDNPAVVVPGSHGYLATSKYNVFFHGKSSHAGKYPELGRNVMLAMATSILNLYALPRHSDGATRINVGTVLAGSGRNIIADEAKMEIEVRGETTNINKYMEEYALNIIASSAKMHGCTYETRLMGTAYSLKSDEELMKRVRIVCEDKLQLPVTAYNSQKFIESEDVSFMMKCVQDHGGQATFMRILAKEAGTPHSRCFDFDESALKNAVKIFSGTVYDIMK